jgi:hypothetical protein
MEGLLYHAPPSSTVLCSDHEAAVRGLRSLQSDTRLGGYRTDITEQQLRGAPAFARDPNRSRLQKTLFDRSAEGPWRQPAVSRVVGHAQWPDTPRPVKLRQPWQVQCHIYLANHSTRPCSSRMPIHFELDDDVGTTRGARNCSHPEFRSGQPRWDQASPAPISIAVAHLPLRASGSDE